MGYRIVHDASSFVPTGDLAVCFGGAILLVAGIALARRFRAKRRSALWLFPYWLAILGLMLTGAFGLRSASGFRSARDLGTAVTSGRARVVEGVVTGLRETGGHNSQEEFVVDGVTFRHGGNRPGAAFHRRWYEGGPVRNGLRVRVTYVVNANWQPEKNEIARLEIDDSPR